MASSLTNLGQTDALYGTATPNGSIANLGTKLKLYDSSSTPAKDGTGFVETANGNGYTTGGLAISRSDWTNALVTGNQQITLGDKVWTATGSIPNVAGAYLTDASDNVLAWWERGSPVSLVSGDTITIYVAAATMIFNLLTDLLYQAVDPRVQLK